MENELQKRKNIRLEAFHYGAGYVYFITICTKDRRNYFWNDAGATIGRPQDVPLTDYGKIADSAINNISEIYPTVFIETYVIMPNHIHLIIRIDGEDENGRPMVAPTVDRIIKQFKGYVSKTVNEQIWQKRFYDHVIRGREDYEEIRKYIYENPINWETDELY